MSYEKICGVMPSDILCVSDDEPILASKLIEEIEKGTYKATITDSGDLYPNFRGTSLHVAEDGRCTITGYYYYDEDTPTCGVDGGCAECEILGVTFSRSVLDMEWGCSEIEIFGREIEYDNDLTEDDVIQAADDNIDWCSYSPDSFSLDEADISDDEIIDSLDDALCDLPDYYAFAKDANGDVFAFKVEYPDDELEEAPEGFEPIDCDEAFRILAERRPGFSLEEE